jgi:hypothetical protein
MAGWKLPWDGGCRCGRTRIRVSEPPLLASACHCTGCQKMSSSAFSLTLTVPAGGFEVVSGEPVIGGLHGPTRHFFCSWCMTWMFTLPADMDTLVNVRASMLDDHSWFIPYLEVNTGEKLPWAETPAVQRYETEPTLEIYLELVEAFQRDGARPA